MKEQVKSNNLRGYKMMKSDMTCNGFQYEIGKEYSFEDELEICESGFHFCENPFNCLVGHDNIEGDKRLFLVEALGEVITEDGTSTTNKIKIVEEIPNIEKFFDDYINKIDYIDRYRYGYIWYNISRSQKLSEEFIEKYIDNVDWNFISRYQKLSESFIEKYKDKVEWDYISAYQTLSEGFIEKHIDKANWVDISTNQKLSEEFIEKHIDRFNKLQWELILINQTLSEEFIEKYIDKVDWYLISKYQTLSEEFRQKYSDKL